MKTTYVTQLEDILGSVAVGVVVLGAADLRIRYANAYVLGLVADLWGKRDVAECFVTDLLPPKSVPVVTPLLHEIAHSTQYDQELHYTEIPFEGFLESRGRTYWNVHITKRAHLASAPHWNTSNGTTQDPDEEALFLSIEDVTEQVRSRLQINAIHAISSAIVGPTSLPLVLDRILQVLQDMFGSRRCAISLLEHSLVPATEAYPADPTPDSSGDGMQQVRLTSARIVAEKGLHPISHNWQTVVDERVLLYATMQERRTHILTDTSTRPELNFPYLEYHGAPYRPGSVLSVPIFEPLKETEQGIDIERSPRTSSTVFGTIDVYHRRARSFPEEEVRWLEQFAKQVGLAIHNARLMGSIDHFARNAVAAREQVEEQVVERTAELKQRNAALQASQQELAALNTRMSTLLASLPVGVILIAASDTSVMMINQQAVKLLLDIGYQLPVEPKDDVQAMSEHAFGLNFQALLETIPIYDAANAPLTYEQWPLFMALQQGEETAAELHTTRKDGQVVYLFVSAAPLRDADGQVGSAILVYQDITHIKVLESAREDFFTTMAHELKTPLANIRAHLSALLARDLTWTSEQQYSFLQTADQQVERLVGMINAFLDASRVEAGALRLAMEAILLPELLEDLEERLQALISSSHKELAIHMPEKLPAVRGDYELIISVLTNLLSNAFRYAPEGDKVELTIELVSSGRRKRPDGVKISVSDRGPGLSKEQQEGLFTRFSTFAALNRPSSDSPGQPEITRRQPVSRWSPTTGLGLYISRGIVEAHGSHLQLVSRPGQGATFAFVLPIYSAHK